jgi:DNA-binding transcriptional ArsR family regulator
MDTIMDKMVFQMQANICKVFSHPKRLEILCELKSGEKSFGELQDVTGLSKANLSQHLSILRDRGVIKARREGQHMHFSVANPKITQACELMHEVLCEQIESRHEATRTS